MAVAVCKSKDRQSLGNAFDSARPLQFSNEVSRHLRHLR